MKLCPKCGKEKSLSEFHRNKRTADGHQAWCASCMIAIAAENRRVDPRLARSHALKRRYKLTLEEYEQMLAEQGGVCAICGTDDPCGPPNAPFFAVDHDHACCSSGSKKTCGRCVRGLLCFRCNCGIGSLDDDVAVLRSAIAYLERSAA